MLTKLLAYLTFSLLCISCNADTSTRLCPELMISENKRFLSTKTGDPFFWSGDTGWLLFTKLNREETERYLEDRRQKRFNVIQVMVLHDVRKAVNVYGDSALIAHNVDKPLITPGNSADDPAQYDYWDHVEYVINLAQKKGLYIALVPVWGKRHLGSGSKCSGSFSDSVR